MDGDTVINIQRLLPLLAQPTVSYSTVYESTKIPSYARSIRLLNLELSNTFDGPLIGTLRLVSLDTADCPSFHALSYVWGTFATPKDTLRCGEGDFKITSNCKDALRQLRHLYGGITIWVDAICINQNNDKEKQHQISLMREIYMRSEKVYIWIGNETPALERAIKCLKAAARIDHLPIYPDRAKKFTFSIFQQVHRFLKMMLPALRILTLYTSFQVLLTQLRVWRLSCQYRQDDFDELFNQEWFLRVWTFQETILAYDSVIVCGSLTINWDSFVRGFKCISYFCTFWRPHWTSRVDHPTIVYYGAKMGPNEVIPQSFQAFSGVIDLWMRVKRPRFGLGQRHFPDVATSFCEYGKTCRNINMYFLPDGLDLSLYKMFIYMVFVSLLFSTGTYGLIPWDIWILFLLSEFTVVISLLAMINLTLLTSFRRDRGEEDKGDTVALLEGVVHTLRQRKATNPKDKVFALYSVLESFGLQLDKPNYSKTQSQIYHELFLALLQQKPWAIVLLLDAGQNLESRGEMSMVDGPSWVPNWSRPPNLKIPNDYFRGLMTANAPYVRLRRDSRNLLVYGHFKGYIEFCSRKFYKVNLDEDVTSLHEAVETFVNWIAAVRDNIRPVNPYKSDINQVLSSSPSRMLLQSDLSNWLDIYLVSRQEIFTLEHNHHANRMVDVCRFFTETMRGFEPQRQYHDIIKQLTRDLLENKDTLTNFIEIINDLVVNDRRPFITSHGYLGCGSKGVAVGDQIAFIQGVPAPLLLRRFRRSNQKRFDMKPNHRYNIICSAFILGFPIQGPDESDYYGKIKLL